MARDIRRRYAAWALLLCARCSAPGLMEPTALGSVDGAGAEGHPAATAADVAPENGGDGGEPDAPPCSNPPIVIHDCDATPGAGGPQDTFTPGGSPELNLIGIGSSPTDEARVHVESGGPMILALSAGYERTHWIVTAGPTAVIERILLIGINAQTATGPAGVAIESHSQEEGSPLWANGWQWCCTLSCPYRGDGCAHELARVAEELAGRALTAFAGCNQASEATVQAACACPPLTCNAPENLVVECSDPGGTPASDPSVLLWLGSIATTGGCGAVTTTADIPTRLPASCTGDPTPTLVTFTATDEMGNQAECASTVTVLDRTPPAVTMDAIATCLWPPNHDFRDVATVAALDVCDPAGVQYGTFASSDERTATEPGAGGPDKCPDARIATGAVQLRAERAGPSGADNGRVYGRVGVTATDGCGNSQTVRLPERTADGCPGAVCVSHDWSLGASCEAVDDGQDDATVCN